MGKAGVCGAISGLRALPCVVVLMWLLCSGMSSCSGDDNKVYAANIAPEVTPTMTTTDVSTLISDSGIVRYKVDAPVWYVYDEAAEPKWTFPKSLHLESFDEMFNKEATIDCDSATYLTNKQLWRLDGHVRVVNMAGEKFLTNQLFWNQKQQVVYSDSFIQIIRADRVMEGYGFVSDERMTDFSVHNVSAILPAEMMGTGTGGAKATADTAAAAADTLKVATRAPRRPNRIQ
ncbi:MAG: LPS export ABC transporter periplasmic protein LptC [Paramuribaculum sp.]|nr:LPS export ABC transporter periplasmic protein LptC [Paramuribaculum sp.]